MEKTVCDTSFLCFSSSSAMSASYCAGRGSFKIIVLEAFFIGFSFFLCLFFSMTVVHSPSPWSSCYFCIGCCGSSLTSELRTIISATVWLMCLEKLCKSSIQMIASPVLGLQVLMKFGSILISNETKRFSCCRMIAAWRLIISSLLIDFLILIQKETQPVESL